MNTLTELEIQEMIDTIINTRPTYDQLRRIVRNVIGENPDNVIPQGCAVPLAVDHIVERAVQLGLHDQLILDIKKSTKKEIISTSNSRTALDFQIANQFGQMFVELLNCLDDMSEEEFQKYTAEIDKADLTEFEDKLKNKARFSVDMQQTAKISKVDISVLQRTAKKLGYLKYNHLKKKVVKVYMRVKDEFPPSECSADFRFQRLLEKMYEPLPEKYKLMINIDDQLTGIIFDTAYDCLIFNE